MTARPLFQPASLATPVAVVLATLVGGCAPQNAQLTAGDFVAFLAATDSLTVNKGRVPLGEDVEDDTWELYHTIDCREFETASTVEETEALRVDAANRLRICDGEANELDWPPDHETWLDTNGFYAVGETLDPWRGEAVITSEGDIQVAFHHRLPGGEDFRFMFVIDPDFQPKDCVQTADGTATELVDVDGDWVANWSANTEGGSRYYLNSGAFMWDPVTAEENTGSDNPPQWFLPNWWLAGYAAGRTGDDDLRVRTPRYANPELYLALEESELTAEPTVTDRELFHCYVGDLPDCSSNQAQCDAIIAQAAECESRINVVETIAANVSEEFASIGIVDVEGLPSSSPVVETNRWRAFQHTDPASLSRWVEMHYNWVEFDGDPATLEAGDSTSGRFSLFLDAVDSSTRVVVRGTFEIPRLKNDKWTTDYLPPELVERYETELCGGATDPSYIY